MEFFYGLLTAVVFFIVYYIGYKQGNKKPPIPILISEEERKAKQKANKDREDLTNLMNYSVEKALQRKKVT